MTGGQPIDGGLTVPQITRQLVGEGVRRIVVVTDEPDKYPPRAASLRGGRCATATISTAIQRELREIPGVTAIVYDQTCAAEKRRRRKRGRFPDPPKRVFINDLVCEGCGDCSSPVELPLGGAGRDRVRPQAGDRPVELQQGLFLPQGLLPELCHRARRQPAQERGLGLRRPPGVKRPSTTAGAAAAGTRRALRHPGHRASAAPASSPSAPCSAWPRISKARAARSST